MIIQFAQGSRKTYSEYGGSGLGLHISRQLVELMNGQVGVSSELGEGSTFAFFVNAPLVLQISDVDSISSQQSTADSAIHIQLAETPKPRKKTRLLVVEGMSEVKHHSVYELIVEQTMLSIKECSRSNSSSTVTMYK
jgi:chemotaxis protein histidine kinase CheA